MSDWGVVISQSGSGLIVWVDGGFPGARAYKGGATPRWACGSTGRGPGRTGAFLLLDAVSAGSR